MNATAATASTHRTKPPASAPGRRGPQHDKRKADRAWRRRVGDVERAVLPEDDHGSHPSRSVEYQHRARDADEQPLRRPVHPRQPGAHDMTRRPTTTTHPHQVTWTRKRASENGWPGSGVSEARHNAPANCSHTRGSGPAGSHCPATNHASTTMAGPMERRRPAAERWEPREGFKRPTIPLFSRPHIRTADSLIAAEHREQLRLVRPQARSSCPLSDSRRGPPSCRPSVHSPGTTAPTLSTGALCAGRR